jgi:ATP adenylyltransferase
MVYIKDFEKRNEGCVFCAKPSQSEDEENLILYRGERSYVVMNLYPYNNGHLLIVPFVHVPEPADLDDATGLELWQLVTRSTKVLREAFRPDGFNIGINVGRGGGAGIHQHLHVHVVPRWNGDTNFMPVVGETKVISQALSETYQTLRSHFSKLG